MSKIVYNHKAVEKKWREKWEAESVSPADLSLRFGPTYPTLFQHPGLLRIPTERLAHLPHFTLCPNLL